MSADLHDAISILRTWGEPCVYSPAGGEARDITAKIDEEGTFEDAVPGIFSKDRLTVFVLRDKENATYGGIDEPKMYDGLHRDSDPEDKIYTFTGEKRDVSADCWTLGFAYNVQKTAGGHLQPR
jgi:hypothetical protein